MAITDLYQLLDASKEDDQSQIRRRYLKKALHTHPDKGGDQELFQQVYFAYSILSDPTKREVYDLTGKTDTVDQSALFDESLKVEITEDMIEQDKKLYQNSLDEQNDIKQLYTKYKGNYTSIFHSLMHSTDEDHQRVIDLVNKLINDNELEKFSEWKKTTSKSAIKKLETQGKREAKEAEKASKEMGVDSFDGLKALIQNKQNQRSGYASVVNNLEAKYGGVNKPKTKKSKAATRKSSERKDK